MARTVLRFGLTELIVWPVALNSPPASDRFAPEARRRTSAFGTVMPVEARLMNGDDIAALVRVPLANSKNGPVALSVLLAAVSSWPVVVPLLLLKST